MKPWYRSQTQWIVLSALACVVIIAFCPAGREAATGLLGVLLLWMGTGGRARARRRLTRTIPLLLLALALSGCTTDRYYHGTSRLWQRIGPQYRGYVAKDAGISENDRQARALLADEMDRLVAAQGATTRP